MGARIAATLGLIVMTTPALAAGVLPLKGIFGNEAGCRLYASGEMSKGYLLLTPDSFASEAVGCDFESLVASGEAGFTVKATCSGGSHDEVHIIDHGRNGYGVTLKGRAEIGPMGRCPPISDGPEVSL